MKRNYGLDFLRIVSMFMVAVLHTLGQGGILSNTEPLSIAYIIAWTFEIFSYCAVNCFALISGYVLYQSKTKISRALNLYLQTAYYTVLAVVIFLVIKPDAVGEMTILSALFPISSAQYWYISAYFGVLILMPLLNTVIAHTDKKVLGSCLLTIFVVFCICPLIFQSEPYMLVGGYSMVWLCLMYLVGGFMHKYDIPRKIKAWWAWITIAAMLALACGIKFAATGISQYISIVERYSDIMISYTSPAIVLIALCLFVLCSKMTFRPMGKQIIKMISPAVLGVYLSHVNPLVWKNWMGGIAVSATEYPVFVMVCLVLLFAAILFAAGIILDWIRIGLFKLFRIQKLLDALDKKLSTKANAI